MIMNRKTIVFTDIFVPFAASQEIFNGVIEIQLSYLFVTWFI